MILGACKKESCLFLKRDHLINACSYLPKLFFLFSFGAHALLISAFQRKFKQACWSLCDSCIKKLVCFPVPWRSSFLKHIEEYLNTCNLYTNWFSKTLVNNTILNKELAISKKQNLNGIDLGIIGSLKISIEERWNSIFPYSMEGARKAKFKKIVDQQLQWNLDLTISDLMLIFGVTDVSLRLLRQRLDLTIYFGVINNTVKSGFHCN